MFERFNRRNFLRGSVAGATGWMIFPSGLLARGQSPNENLNIAVIGLGGRGSANLNGVSGENIVALCDVDEQRAGKAYEKFSGAKKYHDFRKMLDEMESQIDAVVVSTPDHTHAHPSVKALRMGKHLYCEKPLAHSVSECRLMKDLAREKGLATQLGAQRHTLTNMHRVVELVQTGAIGEVREVHAWIGGDRGMPSKPAEFPAVPSHLKWDLWLGPAKDRPYSPEYCPYKWRFWWDFGTGETGNWGCHILDISYWALGLKYCTKVSASGPPVDPERTPKSMQVQYEFPARGDKPPVTLHWYHTKTPPPVVTEKNLPSKGANTLFIGSKGMLICGFSNRKLLPEDQFKDFQAPEPYIPDSPGFYKEWISACKGGQPATCNFDYSGPMAETVLLGNVAYRAGQQFDWDAEKLTAPNCDAIEPHIRPEYREGWPL